MLSLKIGIVSPTIIQYDYNTARKDCQVFFCRNKIFYQICLGYVVFDRSRRQKDGNTVQAFPSFFVKTY